MRKNPAAISGDFGSELSQPILRHRTAIRRGSQSRPVYLALTQGLIGPDRSFFDYGCGFGEDVRLLKESGVDAEGWDPHYFPHAARRPAECVNLGYVLNVIEDPIERQDTLCSAFALARRVLVVSVRIDQSLNGGTDFSDGLVTNSGSFQKIYTQSEFREYLQTVLGRKPYMAGLGIAYVFKDDAVESAHLAHLSIIPPRQKREFLAQFSEDPDGQRLLEVTRTLGRLPLPSEFEHFPNLLLRFGSRSRIEKLVSGVLRPENLQETKALKRNGILTYFAMLRLRGVRPPPVRLLPPETQADIKLFWPSYKRAMNEGEKFLFSLAKPELIREACLAAPVGKRLPSDLYLHRSAEESLPPLLRVLLFAACQVVGDVDYNIVKISVDGRKASFLNYRDFDEEAHPPLLHSVRVHLPTASYAIRDYSSSVNPPILHRKDALVDRVYPGYSAFAELTRQEEECGLLSQADIGFRDAWQRLLNKNELQVVGHNLVPRPPVAGTQPSDA